MAFCRLGPIPHSKFLGWDEADQAKAVAYERWLADHCRSCGQKRSTWLNENGKELRDPPFEVVEVLCPPCEALGFYREEAKDRDAEHVRHGLHLAFKRVSHDANDDVS